jgi:hypothetical protein
MGEISSRPGMVRLRSKTRLPSGMYGFETGFRALTPGIVPEVRRNITTALI